MRTVAFCLSLGLVFVIPFQNIVNIDGLGTIAKAAGLLVMAFWLLTVVSERQLRRPTLFHGMVFLFVMWNAASLLWSIDVALTADRIMTYVQLFGLVYIVWDLYTTRWAVNAAFQAYVLGAWVSVISQLLNYQSGVAEVTNRYSATGFNSNALAMILGLGMPLAWYLITAPAAERSRNRLLRLVNILYLPASMFAILLTASRAGAFAVLPMGLLILASLPRIRPWHAALTLAAIGGAAAFIVVAVPQASFDRLAATGSVVRHGTWNERLAIWRESGNIIAENPLLGTGAKTHRVAARTTQKVAHNFALSLMAELGLIGLLLFLTPLLVAALQMRNAPMREWSMWLTLFVIWLFNNLTHDFDFSKHTWLLMSLAVSSTHVLRRPATQQAPTPPPLAGLPATGEDPWAPGLGPGDAPRFR